MDLLPFGRQAMKSKGQPEYPMRIRTVGKFQIPLALQFAQETDRRLVKTAISSEGTSAPQVVNCIYPVRDKTYNAFPEPEKKREEFS